MLQHQPLVLTASLWMSAASEGCSCVFCHQGIGTASCATHGWSLHDNSEYEIRVRNHSSDHHHPSRVMTGSTRYGLTTGFGFNFVTELLSPLNANTGKLGMEQTRRGWYRFISRDLLSTAWGGDLRSRRIVMLCARALAYHLSQRIFHGQVAFQVRVSWSRMKWFETNHAR